MIGTTLRQFMFGAGLFALAIVSAACSSGGASGGQEGLALDVNLTEFEIALDSSDIPAGTPVTFNIINDGVIEHNFIIEEVGADDEPLTEDAKLESIQPGETATLTFTFDEAGEFQIGCHIPGHYEAGMVREITVGG